MGLIVLYRQCDKVNGNIWYLCEYHYRYNYHQCDEGLHGSKNIQDSCYILMYMCYFGCT